LHSDDTLNQAAWLARYPCTAPATLRLQPRSGGRSQPRNARVERPTPLSRPASGF
ncbi:hypothetical protein T484DRAFT_3648758, partial [Baffinella frigidus]